MERRAFLKFLLIGAGAATTVAASSQRSEAFTGLAPLEPIDQTQSPAPESAVATDADMEHAKVEKTWWYRRRYWRWRRRAYWRRRYWRRRYYWRRPYWRRRYWRRRYWRRYW